MFKVALIRPLLTSLTAEAMAIAAEYEYQPVPDPGPEPSLPKARASWWPSRRDCILVAVAGVLAGLLTFLAVRGPWPWPRQTAHVRQDCGNSSAEALAQGCTFDPLTFTWLPARCPRDMLNEFLDYSGREPWKYWMDKAGTVPVRDDYQEVLQGTWYWTTNAEHLTHCVFMVLRYYKITERGETPDRLTMSYGHTKHCLMLLLDIAETSWPYWNTINTHGNSGFSYC